MLKKKLCDVHSNIGISRCCNCSCSEMKRRFLRRRSLLLLLIVCILVYMSGKLFVVNAGSEDLNLYFNLHEFTDNVHNALKLPFTKRTSKRFVRDVNCAAILNGDKSEINKAKELTKTGNYSRKLITDKEYIQLTANCDSFKRTRSYDNYFASREEVEFPIAYSILLYKDVEQAERLLRAIYTPQNYFCLHVDADSKQEVHDAVQGIANCFDNVFVVSRKEYMVYAGFTRLQADLNCMENLLQRGKDWKYFINLPSQEYPLKTNKEIVKILRIYNGANDIEGLTGNRRLEYRYKHRFVFKHVNDKAKPKVMKSSQQKDDPPYNITVVKGSAYGVFSRDFVHFVINNKIARELLDWFRDVLSPDEYYWATLNFNHHIGTPGSFYKGKPDDKPWLAVFAAWGGENPCHGKFVRGVCVFGVGDLKALSSKHHLFANKFYIDYQRYALDCMEEWHYNKTAEGDLKSLNISYYESLPFIKRDKGR
ncbi:beta-1,3-galactosyl-O-glycosyl-glycoprotein beta-1,6-N-acetylglucosaminyltransferase-like isoform X2 [Mercenaria mercenaria]|uniref:beta-1,3-galactosyl-O-glycosyl-glycoprotein beta-1,6-N-acetylglucosaminyltransferase-like isoform X2 n=1 Tax=Mercenaria mercenaria TaxID=6596 RepID=UPI00234F6BEB|nr:beta-1,3-galactosyl-O-glycosyl-glycoprotein beta-1,6-N-acetylglucosaminyltransferase-like isoform X2 [Mercenaria mercenaria]